MATWINSLCVQERGGWINRRERQRGAQGRQTRRGKKKVIRIPLLPLKGGLMNQHCPIRSKVTVHVRRHKNVAAAAGTAAQGDEAKEIWFPFQWSPVHLTYSTSKFSRSENWRNSIAVKVYNFIIIIIGKKNERFREPTSTCCPDVQRTGASSICQQPYSCKHLWIVIFFLLLEAFLFHSPWNPIGLTNLPY